MAEPSQAVTADEKRMQLSPRFSRSDASRTICFRVCSHLAFFVRAIRRDGRSGQPVELSHSSTCLRTCISAMFPMQAGLDFRASCAQQDRNESEVREDDSCGIDPISATIHIAPSPSRSTDDKSVRRGQLLELELVHPGTNEREDEGWGQC